jgi:hypothetical protein
MMLMLKQILSSIVFVVVCTAAPCSFAEEWNFVLAPYALLPNISGDASLGRIDGVDVDVSTGDILESLELGGMMQGEAHHSSGAGLLFNYAFMNLGDSASGPRGFTNLDANIFQGLLEAFGTYRFTFDTSVLDAYAGIRWWDIDLDIDTTTPIGARSYDRSQDWVDPVLGARWIPRISNSWRLLVQGDVGGFDTASHFTWLAQLGGMWDAAEDITLIVAYRALSVDYDTGTQGTKDYFQYDTITQGPLFGVVFTL